ncbi:E3 ubiquitin-protein ligase HECTD3 [Bufo gargarizans]|uniref:E3 ubiquitin-protein ligase HECTD3 n=1 Tax=Bufo gargarizans TaxID=30331 RepID=UPI001CF1F914|nr:E3 ubiquitin-protein ligase HECTD3 [Bufo gargarizans]XP_044157623.1 E3 ubiquitin-protein ligase HECTD3 [Bufo gargarizans]XP_044157624.1 E3 ubiquitin-protein ligase HECTD3 [Bufo gargarizans]
MQDANNLHRLLGRIRCVLECIDCFRRAVPLPEALCYVPGEVLYKVCKDPSSASSARSLLTVWEAPGYSKQNLKKLSRATVEIRKGSCIRATGEKYGNASGLWVKLSKEQMAEYRECCDMAEGWVLLCQQDEGGDRLVPIESPNKAFRQQQIFGVDYNPLSKWEDVMDATFSVHLSRKSRITECDVEATEKLRFVPPSWTYECDEDLVHFLYECVGKEDENFGDIKQIVESINVSSFVEENSVPFLTDGRHDTYWQSDGSENQHWIQLLMKEGTIIKKLLLTVDFMDGSFMPKRVLVFGGERDSLKKLRDVVIEDNLIGDVCILDDMTSHMPVIEIRFTECFDDRLDVRIHGIKIKSSKERDLGLTADMFHSPNLVRYPRLEAIDPGVLYRRATVIKRFVKLLDNVLHRLVPLWDHSVGTFNQLKHIKPFLLLSKCRSPLITQCLKDSETSRPNSMPRLYINRRLAVEHRDNPALDPTYKKTVFSQVYEGLKPTDKSEKPLDYRWPIIYDQWWECKFIAEGIIDQGGGFRDSLSDISEELCPSSADSPMPLPFFVRTSNQGNGIGEARDMYVTNPSCRDLAKYEWIGQLMGAALRGKEFLVLALPGLIWKRLTGEEVSWSKDFPSIDSLLVKLLEMMEVMDKDTFEFKFGGELTYTTVLSDQRMVELVPGGSNISVRYEDRQEFIRMVQKARLEESKEQIEALQAGLLKVVPQAVLDLLTWQELEKRVCGDPEISVEALKKQARFEELEPTDTRVLYFWEALSNFTNEDRSRFLRFVTGRSRLPAPIYIFPGKFSSETTDALPESSTCSSILYLPSYPSAKICEEKLRYAAYNCVAIDTDMSPWEE